MSYLLDRPVIFNITIYKKIRHDWYIFWKITATKISQISSYWKLLIFGTFSPIVESVGNISKIGSDLFSWIQFVTFWHIVDQNGRPLP